MCRSLTDETDPSSAYIRAKDLCSEIAVSNMVFRVSFITVVYAQNGA